MEKFNKNSKYLTKRLTKKEKLNKGIFFTPLDTATKLLNDSLQHIGDRGIHVLEPSSGCGQFLKELVNKKQIIERENSNNSFADADASVDAHANNNSFSSTNSNSHNQNIIRPSNDSMNTPKRITNKNKINKEIDLLLEKASPNAYPIKR